MYGEAHGQAAAYGAGDPTEQAVGVTIRNRFNDPAFGNVNTFQDAIVRTQFMGINTSIVTGTSPELANATAVFAGSSSVSVGNSKCFFSPDLTGWKQIQAAISSGTTAIPIVASDPVCFSGNRQFVYKSSISNNTNGNGAPAFIFEQWRRSLTR